MKNKPLVLSSELIQEMYELRRDRERFEWFANKLMQDQSLIAVRPDTTMSTLDLFRAAIDQQMDKSK
jgi:hypothetical protein